MAELGEDTAQGLNARRQRVAIVLDCLGQQIEKGEGLFVGKVKVHRGYVR
jgi:hypothetical protein